MKSLTGIIITLLFALSTQSNAHEFWLEPKKFQAKAGESVEIDLRNGQDFQGIELSWYDPRIDRAVVIRNGKAEAYQGAPGDLPGMTVTTGAGLTTVAYASKLSRLTYDGWDKVLSFATHKDMPWLATRHAERGLPQEGVSEGYWRFSKTVINAAGAGTDMDSGMETEFVLLDPVTAGPELRARLLYQGKPRPNAQVELWQKQGEEVTRTLHRTGPDGIVALPVHPGHTYMIDAVVLREPSSSAAREAGVMWESLWANLTFAVPE